MCNHLFVLDGEPFRSETSTLHWRIWGAQGRTPSASKFFRFHAVFGKKLQTNRLAYPLWQLVPPSQKEHPGSATGLNLDLRQHYTVADPGFPRGGGANSPGGRQHMILPKFPKNCMKLKEFGPPGGGARVQNFTM